MKETPTIQESTVTELNKTESLALFEPGKIGDLPASRRDDIESFLEYLALCGASKETCRGYVIGIKSLGVDGKPYRELTKEDLVRWMRGLDERYSSPHTRHDYRRRVKRSLRWLHNGEDRERPLPEAVKCIKVGKLRRSLGVEVLTEHEVKAMVEACDTQRDRAMLFTLYESGCRAGELLSLRIRDVELDRHGAVLRVRGKTGERRIRIVAAAPDLQLWLNMHPCAGNPDAPLWPRARDLSKTIGVTNLGHLVKKYARKAKVSKRVHPHVFRHSRATHLANVLTEAQMRVFFGWTKASEIPSIYVHLSGRDVDATLFKHYGIKSEEPSKPQPLAPKTCSRCGFSNTPSARFCTRCSAVLDIKAAIELDELREAADDITARVVQEFIRRAPELVRDIIEQTGISAEIAQFHRAPLTKAEGGGISE